MPTDKQYLNSLKGCWNEILQKDEQIHQQYIQNQALIRHIDELNCQINHLSMIQRDYEQLINNLTEEINYLSVIINQNTEYEIKIKGVIP